MMSLLDEIVNQGPLFFLLVVMEHFASTNSMSDWFFISVFDKCLDCSFINSLHYANVPMQYAENFKGFKMIIFR